MLDIKLIRETPDLVKERLATRHDDSASMIDEVLSCDENRRKAETQKQEL
ncbi:serine--tRNA ligase, partial [Akkermansiaceae bacterium]|nr:serine--tRNA ligase [Akkermansiaceae bacterium]